MTLQQLVEHYGYLAVLAGGLVEGETVVVLAGMAAHRGYLGLGGVIALAALGTVTATQFWFQLGRVRGASWLARHPRWLARVATIRERAHRHQVPVILLYRFLYGLRTVTPFTLGMMGVPSWRFLAVDVIATLVWAAGVATLGYAVGDLAEHALGRAEHVEWMVGAAIAGLGALAWAISTLRARRVTPPPPEPGAGPP